MNIVDYSVNFLERRRPFPPVVVERGFDRRAFSLQKVGMRRRLLSQQMTGTLA